MAGFAVEQAGSGWAAVAEPAGLPSRGDEPTGFRQTGTGTKRLGAGRVLVGLSQRVDSATHGKAPGGSRAAAEPARDWCESNPGRAPGSARNRARIDSVLERRRLCAFFGPEVGKSAGLTSLVTATAPPALHLTTPPAFRCPH